MTTFQRGWDQDDEDRIAYYGTIIHNQREKTLTNYSKDELTEVIGFLAREQDKAVKMITFNNRH